MARPQIIAELQLEGVGVDPKPIEVVEELHVPDIKNRGELAVTAVLRFYCCNWEISQLKLRN